MSASGSGLPADTKSKMENSFGADFSDIRVHQNSATAVSQGAVAYTQGNDVHFATGQYAPGTQHGDNLIGHELAHVMQQQAGGDADSASKATERKLAGHCAAGGTPAHLK